MKSVIEQAKSNLAYFAAFVYAYGEKELSKFRDLYGFMDSQFYEITPNKFTLIKSIFSDNM
jgi:hypothetical protein